MVVCLGCLVEGRVVVVVVREHVRPVVHRDYVWVGAAAEEQAGDVNVASLAGEVEGRYLGERRCTGNNDRCTKTKDVYWKQ